MIAISGWASSCRRLGRGPRRLISSTSSVIATIVSIAPSTGFSGLRLARLPAARSRAATCSAVTGLPSGQLQAADPEGVAQPVVGDDPALRQRRLDLAGGVEADQALRDRFGEEGGRRIERLEVGIAQLRRRRRSR